MPLVVHYWADLQAVHGLRWYGNITRTRNIREYMLALALCLVIIIIIIIIVIGLQTKVPYVRTFQAIKKRSTIRIHVRLSYHHHHRHRHHYFYAVNSS